MTQTKVFNNFADFDRVDSIARHKEPETHKTSIRNSLEANDSDFEGQLASLQSTKQIVTGLNRLTEQEQLQMQWRVNRRVDEEETQLDRKYQNQEDQLDRIVGKLSQIRSMYAVNDRVSGNRDDYMSDYR